MVSNTNNDPDFYNSALLPVNSDIVTLSNEPQQNPKRSHWLQKSDYDIQFALQNVINKNWTHNMVKTQNGFIRL